MDLGRAQKLEFQFDEDMHIINLRFVAQYYCIVFIYFVVHKTVNKNKFLNINN